MLAGVVLVASGLFATGCGDDTDDAGTGSTTTSTSETGQDQDPGSTSSSTTSSTTSTLAPLTASFRGVTETTIELGIAYVDFEQLFDLDFVEFTHGDEVAIWEALLAGVNADGGINGRELTAIYDTYLPVGNVEAEASCGYFTEDNSVFAVLGLWVGESVLCLTELHDTIHVGHLVRQEWVDRSSAVLATPDAVQERSLEVLLTVLDETGRLEERTVGVFTDVIAEGTVESVVEPFFDGRDDITLGSVAVLQDDEGDQIAIAAEVRAFTERWRTEEVDLLLVVGNNGLALIPEVGTQLDDIEFATAAAGVLQQTADGLPDDEKAYYRGVLTTAGLSPFDGEQFDEPLLQECIATVEAAVPGLTVEPPNEREGPDDWYAGIRDACGSLAVFVAAATAAGPELTNESFREGLESLGSIDLPGTAFASFGPGKWDGDDGFRLVSYDPFAGEEGAFTPLTDLIDTGSG